MEPRHQIEQATGRKTIHIAEVISEASWRGGRGRVPRLERSAAANAVIGVAHDPGRSSSHARDDPVRHLVTVGDESGAVRRLACGTSRRGICLRCRHCRTPERNRRASESHHVPPSFRPLPTRTAWPKALQQPLRAEHSAQDLRQAEWWSRVGARASRRVTRACGSHSI